jgi:hypothetical protein
MLDWTARERPEEVGRNGPLIAARAANAGEAAPAAVRNRVGRDSLVTALLVGDLFRSCARPPSSTWPNRPNRIEQPPQEIVCWTVAAVVAIEYADG